MPAIAIPSRSMKPSLKSLSKSKQVAKSPAVKPRAHGRTATAPVQKADVKPKAVVVASRPKAVPTREKNTDKVVAAAPVKAIKDSKAKQTKAPAKVTQRMAQPAKNVKPKHVVLEPKEKN